MNNMENSHSTELGLLFEALSKAQGKIVNALKDKKNPFFKSSYADLASVWDACRDPLSNHGLAIIQTVEGTKDGMYLNTWLGHSSGQWMKSKLPLIVMKQDPQSVGSAITYGRRYALSALVGICADEDDDGEKAMGRKNEKTKSEEVKLPENKQMTDQEIDDYLHNWGDEREEFKKYMEEVTNYFKWTISDTIESFKKDNGRVEQKFIKWKSQQEKNRKSA